MSRIGGSPPSGTWAKGEASMKLTGDKIVIESRYEIDDIIKMIEVYQKSGERKNHVTDDELNRLKDQLDVLYMSW